MNTDPAQYQETPRSTVVATRLRAALAVLDISAAGASRRLGWTQSNFQRQVKGDVKLSVDQLDWIEQRLGIPMTYLLGITDELPNYNRGIRAVRPAPEINPAGVVFNDGTGGLASTGSESFLSESNRRPFHYKRHGQVLPFPFRPNQTPQNRPAGQVAQVIPFPA